MSRRPRLSWSGSRAAQEQADAAWRAARQAAATRWQQEQAAKQRRRKTKRAAKPWDYSRYLASKGWKRRRQAAIDAAGGKCQTCGSAYRIEVHHKHYRTVGNESPEDLAVLCHECHANAHEPTHGALDEVSRRFLEVVRSI